MSVQVTQPLSSSQSLVNAEVLRFSTKVMDSSNGQQEPFRTRSFSRESSLASSLSLSRSLPLFISTNDVDDSESVSEAGDIGDRSLRRRHSIGRSNRLFSSEDLLEQGVTDDTSRQEHDLSVVKPLPEHMTTSPLPTKSLLSPETNKPVKDNLLLLDIL